MFVVGQCGLVSRGCTRGRKDGAVTSSSTAEWGTGRTAAAARDGWGSGEKRARAKGKKEKKGVGGWGMNEWMRCEADGGGRREQRLDWLAASGQWTR